MWLLIPLFHLLDFLRPVFSGQKHRNSENEGKQHQAHQ